MKTNFLTHLCDSTENKEKSEVQVSDTIWVSQHTIMQQLEILAPLE